MGNQTVEYVSDRLLKVLGFWFICLLYYLNSKTMYFNIEECARQCLGYNRFGLYHNGIYYKSCHTEIREKAKL